MTTATATITPQINDLIDWIRKNNRAARAARFLVQFLDLFSKWRRDIFIFDVLTTTQARSSKSFILSLYMKTIRAKQARVHFGYFVQSDQFGIITKHLTQRKVLL